MDEDDYPWWREGICAEIGSALFFMDDNEHSVTAAKDACFMCPVQLLCLADALEADLEYGIFGGFARDQRRALRKRVINGSDPQALAAKAIQREKRKRAGWRASTSSRPSSSRRRAWPSATSESPETSARTGSPGDTR